MKRDVYLLHLDRHHLSDRLFVDELAREMAGAGAPRCMIVHGSGEKLERTFESQGLFPEREGGILQVEGIEQERLAERAVREVNGTLVAALTDAAVAAVGVQGADRGLLHRADDGTLTTGRVGWIEDLLRQRVVPVVSALVADAAGGDPAREAPPAEAVIALAGALDDFAPTIVFFTEAGGEEPRDVPAERAAEETKYGNMRFDGLPEPEVARAVAEVGLPTLVTSIGGLLELEK